jgi:hypothetical protein
LAKSKHTRITIPKKIRFEIFKRDKFKCQYCGHSAPEILLQIDHITPVSKGGNNDLLNLITSCFDCNNGKRDKLLSDDTVINKRKEQLEQLQERREQLDMMMSWYDGLQEINLDIQNKLKGHWESLAKGFTISESGILKIKKWSKEFEFGEILTTMDIAAEQYFMFNNGNLTEDSWETAFNKIPAILKVRRDSIENPDLKEFLYIRGMIKNRLRCYDPQLTLDWLKAARSWGASIDELKYIARTTVDWRSFSEDIDNLIEQYGPIDNDNSSQTELIDDLPF